MIIPAIESQRETRPIFSAVSRSHEQHSSMPESAQTQNISTKLDPLGFNYNKYQLCFQ